jgi:hypothetical protein
MHEMIDKTFYLGPKFGTLINKKWITISELLQNTTQSFKNIVKSIDLGLLKITGKPYFNPNNMQVPKFWLRFTTSIPLGR